MPKTFTVIRLTEAQASALDCSGIGLEPQTFEEAALYAAWDKTDKLTITAATQDAIASAICELSNLEDEHARENHDVFARRASLSLSALYGKVLKVVPRG